MVNISYLEVPLFLGNKTLNENMYLTAEPMYKNIDIKWENLWKMVKSDYRQYSPFWFKGGKKISENWDNDLQDLLILDVDDGLSINEAKRKFKDYKYLICTTKSHQKEKKGIVCDRFRVILKAKNVQKYDYFECMKNLELIFPFIDKQVNTKTGAFLGFSNCEYWYNDGKEFDFEIIKPIEKREVVNRKRNIDVDYENDLPIDEIKDLLDVSIVREIVESCGYKVDRNFKFKMRVDEKTPSASIRHDGLIKDFGSDFTSDVIGFVREVTNLDFRQSVAYVANFVNVQVEQVA